MRSDAIGSSAYAGALVAVTGLLAWVTGRPFVFPSLGPTAYLLATVRRGEPVSAHRVVGGHLIGVVVGLVAYHAIAPGLVLTAASAPLAGEQLRLVASGVLAVAGTSAGMLATEAAHPPACATTLIVSLGLLSSVVEGGIVLVSVALLYGIHVAVLRLYL